MPVLAPVGENTKEAAFTQQDTLLVKGAAMVIILWHHLFTYDFRMAPGVWYLSLGSYHGSKYETILGSFGHMGLSMMLLLSGYGLWLSWQRAEDRPRWLAKRLLGVYRRFWQIFVLIVPLAALLGDPMIQLTPAALLRNFFAIELTYNEEWWFLTPYLLLILFFPLVWLALRGRRPLAADVLLVIGFYLAVKELLPVLYAAPAMARWSGSLAGTHLYNTLRWATAFLLGCLLAKWDGLAAFRRLFHSRAVQALAGLALLGCVFLLRVSGVLRADAFLALGALLGADALLHDLPVLSPLLRQVGAQSMSIWLVHTFYCYHLCQPLVYAPRVPVLILGWLLALSWGSGRLVDLLYSSLGKLVKTRKSKATVGG